MKNLNKYTNLEKKYIKKEENNLPTEDKEGP